MEIHFLKMGDYNNLALGKKHVENGMVILEVTGLLCQIVKPLNQFRVKRKSNAFFSTATTIEVFPL